MILEKVIPFLPKKQQETNQTENRQPVALMINPDAARARRNRLAAANAFKEAA